MNKGVGELVNKRILKNRGMVDIGSFYYIWDWERVFFGVKF